MKRKGLQDNRYVIDSYGWIEYFGGGKLADKYAKYIEKCSTSTHFTPSIVLYEVYKKFISMYSEEDAIKAIMHIDNYTTVVDINTKSAIKGAEASVDEKLHMADALIRAVANEFGATVVTSDPHFKNKKNVIFIE